MSEIKLLPCPFCDGEAKLCDASSKTYGRYMVRCKEVACTIRPKTEWHETKEEAIRHWNHRRPMERIIERLEDYRNFEDNDSLDRQCIDRAIEIVKEECGISE